MKPEVKIHTAKNGLIALAILTPVFVFLFGLILPKQPASPMLNDSFWAHKIKNENQYDIVIVGDSRIYRGIDPEILGQKLKLSAFNFGFSSAGLDSTLLNSAIQLLNPYGKKIILIGVTPASFTRESLKNEHYNSLKKMNQKDLWIRKNLYPSLTFFDNYSISELKKISQNEKYYQNFNFDGFAFSNRVPSDSFIALQPYFQFLNNNNIETGALAKFFLLINQFHQSGTSCYGFRVPVASPIEKLENTVFEFDLFKNEFEKANGIWIDLPKHGFTSYDGSHLEGNSAIKFSGILSDSLLKKPNF